MATSSILHAVYEHTNAPIELLNNTESFLISTFQAENSTEIILKQTNLVYSVGSITVEDTISTQAPTDIPLSHDDKLKFPASYPWNEEAEAASAPSHLSYLTALMVGILVSLIIFLFYFCRQKQRKNPEHAFHPYLARFRTKDVHIRKTPWGGWKVKYDKALCNQVREYWSCELPDIGDSGTIVFDESLEHTKVTTSSNSESGDTESVSSSSDSLSLWQLDLISSMEEGHGKMFDITSHTLCSSSPMDSRRSCLLRVGLVQFVGQQFAKEDIILKESPMKGWSVTFCNRLADGINDAHNEEIVDFVSTDEFKLPVFLFSNPLQLPL